MFRQKILTILGAITAVSAAIADHIDKISHTTALWITLIGAVAMAAGGAILKALESTFAVTVIGVLVATFGVLAQAGSLIGDKWAQIAVIVGAALTAIGKSLFGLDEGDPGPSNGFIGRQATLLLAGFVLMACALTACDWKKAERPLVSAGYNFQITDLATAKVIAAIKTYKPGSISNDTARKYFNALQKTSQIGQGFSLAIDQTTEINPQTKVQLLTEADRYLAQVDATIAVIDPADTKIREWLLVARATASAFKIAIAATQVTTPTAKVIADVSKAKTTAVATAGNRDINDTVNLINALGAISADFSADVLAQKGLDAAALRTQRDVKYQAVQTFISAELAKL